MNGNWNCCFFGGIFGGILANSDFLSYSQFQRHCNSQY